MPPSPNLLYDRRKKLRKPIWSGSPSKRHGQALVLLSIVAKKEVFDHIWVQFEVSVAILDIELDHAIAPSDVSAEFGRTLYSCSPSCIEIGLSVQADDKSPLFYTILLLKDCKSGRDQAPFGSYPFHIGIRHPMVELILRQQPFRKVYLAELDRPGMIRYDPFLGVRSHD